MDRQFKARENDLITSIEAAYDVDSDDETWMRGMLESLRPGLDQGGGLLGYFYDGTGEELRVWGHTGVAVTPEVLEAVAPILAGLDPAEMHHMLLRCPRVMASASEVLGRERISAYAATNPGGDLNIGDTVGIKCHEPEGWGAMLGLNVPHLTTVDEATETTWAKVAAHATAALRIRRRLQAAAMIAPPDAVLTSAGKVSHAETEAQDTEAQEILSGAVRSRETARGPLRRSDPEEAAGLWQALVDGRWTLLDQHDSDGRRWIIARRNAPVASEMQPLTSREHQVLAYVALGHSNKLIAYTLGLTIAAVANLIARASQKLGANSRVDLIQLLDERTKGGRRGDS